MGRKKERKELDRKAERLSRKLEKVERKRADLGSGPYEASGAGETGWVSPEQPPEWGPGPVGSPVADVLETIARRRSIKRFTDRRVTRAEIERLVEAAARAPNHRMTEPWRFHVLGAESRRAYGEALGARKAKRVEDAEAAALVRRKVADEHGALPAAIAVAMTESDDAEQLREDFAATYMAVQNLCLAAVALGLGTHIKTGAIMDDPAARAAVGVPAGQRIVAFIALGEAAAVPDVKVRTPASELTVWRD